MRKRLLVVFSLMVLAGCQTVGELPVLGPEARTRSGQLSFTTSARSVIGDVILRSLANGDYDLFFSKAGIEVLQIQVRGIRMTATGLMARNGWTGSIGNAPRPLKPWAMLKEIIPYFESAQASAEQPGRWTAKFQRKRGTLFRADIQFSSGESIIFILGL